MDAIEIKRLKISPHTHEGSTTAKIMWTVVACLLPASAWGVYAFGLSALWTLLVSIGAALVTEALVGGLFFKRFTLGDGSAFLTGLLVGMNMPAAVPFYVPLAASVFAIAVVKMTFGGLGHNWMNPALAGRVFVFFSWTSQMTTWTPPSAWGLVDAVTTPTPLGFIKTGMMSWTSRLGGPTDYLAAQFYPVSQTGSSIASWINTRIFGSTVIDGRTVDAFIGNIPGSLGEVSALLLILGAIVLLIRKIITWEIPLMYLGVFGILTWVFGGTSFTGRLFTGDVLFHLSAGGLMLGALYMATDMVTSPLTRKGMLIFGAGCGFLTFLIRFYGSFPEGVSLAIILMNIFVPLINKLTQPARYGVSRKKIRPAKAKPVETVAVGAADAAGSAGAKKEGASL